MHRVKAWPAKAHIRAADADRERVAANLTRHCADGRLTPGELEERLDTVFGARTLGELAAVTRDLPAPPPARSPRRRRRPGRLVAVAITILVLLSTALVGSGLLHLAADDPLGALLAMMLLILCVVLALAALASLLVTLAPLIALGAGIRWLSHRLSSGRASPPWSIRA